MTWRVCHSELVSGHTQIDAGTSFLTPGEIEGVHQKLNAMSRSSRTECGADAPTLRLTLTTATQTIEYLDSFYACVAQQEVVVEGMEPVITELGRLTR